MVRLEAGQFPAAYELYLSQKVYFPLIASVLLDQQDGEVHADHATHPTRVYVEHAFGFAQVFGATTPTFERILQRRLLVDKTFPCTKVRLYTPDYPEFLRADECDNLRSWRQHFRLNTTFPLPNPQNDVRGLTLMNVEVVHTDQVESAFGVVKRFWRTPGDFVSKSNAVLAWVEGQPASLCYAAAGAGGMAEIDVMTLPAYRHLGLAKAVVGAFSRRCLAQNVLPLWDCFTNNAASMALCRSTGFIPLGEPYAFFTIDR